MRVCLSLHYCHTSKWLLASDAAIKHCPSQQTEEHWLSTNQLWRNCFIWQYCNPLGVVSLWCQKYMQDAPCVPRLMSLSMRGKTCTAYCCFLAKFQRVLPSSVYMEEITVFWITFSLSLPDECWILNTSLKKFWIDFLQFTAVAVMNSVSFHRAFTKGVWTKACSPYSGKIGIELWLACFLYMFNQEHSLGYHLGFCIKLLLNRTVWNLVKSSFLSLCFSFMSICFLLGSF